MPSIRRTAADAIRFALKLHQLQRNPLLLGVVDHVATEHLAGLGGNGFDLLQVRFQLRTSTESIDQSVITSISSR